MLSFEDKIALIQENFPELEMHEVSLGRLNFHYEESVQDKKIVVYHLHPNGNGFVYGGHLPQSVKNEKGYVNIRDYEADELIALIKESLEFLSKKHGWQQQKKDRTDDGERKEEHWYSHSHEKIRLVGEDGMWFIFDEDDALEAAFETYAEAEGYLKEADFKRRK
jgi:hypothetical protein